MVQSTGMGQNQYGSINRVGMTQEGRAVYQITSADGYQAANVSIPAQDCDRFEKAYSDMMEAAPKLENYMATHSSPEDVKKMKRKSGFIIGGATGLGLLIPALATKKMSSKLWKWVLSIAGTITGFFAGSIIAAKASIPPGAKEFSDATKVISEIDVKPVEQ